jgi:heterodisulfide reductase subunit B
MVEVLIEDFGYEKMGKHVTQPLDGIKIAGYVGCQTHFKMPVVYYSTLMGVACGGSGKEAGLDGQIIKARQLEEIASK